MGLKIAEAFKDRCFLTVLATGAPATLLADVTCVEIDQLGNRAPLVVAEESDGWYTTSFTPDAAGTWATEWSKTLVPENYVFHYPYKEFKVGGGQEGDIETDVAATHVHAANAEADIAAVHLHVADIITKVNTIDDYVDTEVADIHTDVGTAIADVAAIHVHVDDIHATDLPDLHTDVGTAITNIADIHTDVGTAITAIGDLHATDVPDIHTDIGTVHTDVDAVRARTDRLEIIKAFFGPCLIAATADTTHTDIALGSVTLPNITGTITHVYAGFKFRMLENTNVAANKLNGAQEIQVDTVDAINFVDHQFGVAASTREGGDCIIGAVDLVATVDVFNHAYAFVWDEPLTEVDSLVFNDVQPFLIVSYY